MKKALWFLEIFFLLGAASDVFAARPLSTDDAGTVDKGGFEYEYGFEMAKDEVKEYTFSNVLKYGLLDNVDMGCEAPLLYINNEEDEDEGGLSDINLNLKYNFLKKDDVVNLTGRFDFKTDTGDNDKGLGSGGKDYAITLIASREFESCAFHINLGYTFVGGANDLFNYSLAFEKALGGKCHFVGEIGSETDFSGDFDENSCEALAGLNYALTENFSWDAAVTLPLTEASADYKLISGITVGF